MAVDQEQPLPAAFRSLLPIAQLSALVEVHRSKQHYPQRDHHLPMDQRSVRLAGQHPRHRSRSAGQRNLIVVRRLRRVPARLLLPLSAEEHHQLPQARRENARHAPPAVSRCLNTRACLSVCHLLSFPPLGTPVFGNCCSRPDTVIYIFFFVVLVFFRSAVNTLEIH